MQIVANALPGDVFYVSDEKLLEALLKIDGVYSQFKAAAAAQRRRR